MSVRRDPASARRVAARLVFFGALLTGLVLVGAAPAAAADSVRVRAASSFTAGGSPGAVNVTVTRRSDGCVGLRTVLAIRLSGITPDQVRVQVALAGSWRVLAVGAAGDSAVTTARIAPEKPQLCENKSISVRYRVTFLAGAPGGRATLLGGAYTGAGKALGQGADAARVVARRVATPSPTRSATPSPTPSLEETEPVESVTEESTTQPAVVPVAKDSSGGGGFFSLGTLVMFLGVAMVGIGATLLVFLLRRNRAEPGRHSGRRDGYQDPGGFAGGGYPGGPGPYPAGPAGPAGGGHPTGPPPQSYGPGGGDATLLLPRVPRNY